MQPHISASRAFKILSALGLVLQCSTVHALDTVHASAFREGPLYQSVAAIAPDLAQVVFFRKAEPTSERGPANVYIDREFHTALLPHGFTRLCVLPGVHSIEAYEGDAPTYAGKANPATQVRLDGGKTYFVAVSDQGAGEPVPYLRGEAERLLQGAREQRHVISRASAAVPCKLSPQPLASVIAAHGPAQAPMLNALSQEFLFRFARGGQEAIAVKDRQKQVEQFVSNVKVSGGKEVQVRGHADPIGSTKANRVLSRRRAMTIRQMLIEEGLRTEKISIEAVGSAEPVVTCPRYGGRSSRIACNAPNRRVEVRAQGQK